MGGKLSLLTILQMVPSSAFGIEGMFMHSEQAKKSLGAGRKRGQQCLLV